MEPNPAKNGPKKGLNLENDHIGYAHVSSHRLVPDIQTLKMSLTQQQKHKRKWPVGGAAQLHLLPNLSKKCIFSVSVYDHVLYVGY